MSNESNKSAGDSFTGERWEAYSALLFLRARYYEPGTGRFVSKDSWAGSVQRPQTLHRWGYVQGNPANIADPTGHEGKKAWEISAGEAVWLAKGLYSKAGLIRVCLLNPDNGQCATDTVNDLLTDFICEYGPEHRYFGENDHLTLQLAKSMSICHLRQEFYMRNNDVMAGTYVFDTSQFLEATLDSLLRGDPTGYVLPIPRVDVTHFMGSFDYTISRFGFDKIRFEVRNQTDLASGTRIPPFLGGASVENAEEAWSVEEVLEWNPEASEWSLREVMEQYPIISILGARTREQTGGFLNLQGGGSMRQTFVWYEPYSPCSLFLPLPCPLIGPVLQIEGPSGSGKTA